MTTKPPKKPVKRKEAEAVETVPDAMDRFQRTMDKIVPPKRAEPKKEKTPDK